MSEQVGWINPATKQVADQLCADPVLLMEVLGRINSLRDGRLTFDQLTRAAGVEVHGVWACHSYNAPVAPGIDGAALGESCTMQLLGSGIERDV